MRVEQKFVIPLPIEDARRLVSEVERFAPLVPGLAVRVDIDPRDAHSTTVRVIGELRTGGGIARTVAAEAAARVLRQYAARMTEQARSWAASRGRNAASTSGTADGTSASSAANGGSGSRTGDGASTTPASDSGSRSGSSRATSGSAAAPQASSPRRNLPGFGSGSGRTDVWSRVTDPVGGQRRPTVPPMPPRRRAAARRTVSARDVVVVTGVAVAVTMARRAVQRRLAARAGSRQPGEGEAGPPPVS